MTKKQIEEEKIKIHKAESLLNEIEDIQSVDEHFQTYYDLKDGEKDYSAEINFLGEFFLNCPTIGQGGAKSQLARLLLDYSKGIIKQMLDDRESKFKTL